MAKFIARQTWARVPRKDVFHYMASRRKKQQAVDSRILAGFAEESSESENEIAKSTTFIEFMLSAIKTSLMEAISMSDVLSDVPKDKVAERRNQIEQFLERHNVIPNANVQQVCSVSATTDNRTA